MATSYNPSTVTDGLVFCVDAANPKSYPGTGTTWTDLSGNGRNGTLINGPTFNSNNNGYLSFDGTNDYVSFGDVLDLTTSSISGFAWINITSHKNYNAWIDKLASAGNFRFHTWSDGTLYYGIRNSANAYQQLTTTQTIPLSTWTYIGFTHDYATRQAIIYINGTSSISGTFTIDRGDTGTILTVGYGSNNVVYANGLVSNVSIYNKVLSQSEISQNFNALRGRYGI